MLCGTCLATGAVKKLSDLRTFTGASVSERCSSAGAVGAGRTVKIIVARARHAILCRGVVILMVAGTGFLAHFPGAGEDG